MSWELKSLDQLGYVSRGRSRNRPRDAAHLYGGPYPFIQTADVKHANLFVTDYEQTYSEAGLAQSRLWKAGTLCITIAANIGDTAILGIDACFPDSVIGFIPDDDKADVRFVKYLFDAMLQKRFKQFTQGAAQDNLSQSKLLSLEFPVPVDVMEQRHIADTLSAYDELIENNRRRIQLLEQAARLLYKEWFVHLRFPGHEHAEVTAGIPSRWTRPSLGEVMNLKRGYDLPTGKREPGTVPVVSSSGLTGFHDTAKAEAPGVVTGRYGTIGAVYLVQDDFWPLNTALYVQDFRGNNPFFAFHLLTVALRGTSSNKAAVPGVNRNDLHRMDVLRPPRALQQLFAETVSPIHKQATTLESQISKLSAARDLLLSRLMNGELRV